VHPERSTELVFDYPDVAILTLRGEHDLDTAPQIAQQLACGRSFSQMLVDLSECDFIDSTVISALLRASNRMHARGAKFMLVIPDERHLAIKRIFELMSIERRLPIYPSRADALAAFRGEQRAPTQVSKPLPGLRDFLASSQDDIENEQNAA
jgi:anti-anti-sigma factor